MNQLIEQQARRIAGLTQSIETWASQHAILDTLIRSMRAFNEDRCSLIAAALAYYALLSIFPLMLLLISEASSWIPSDRLIRAVTGFFAAELPISAKLLQDTLRQVVQLRGAVTAASAIGFFWSAASVFDMIQLGVNRAFRVQRARPMWRQRLVSMGMIASVSVLFGLSLLLTTSVRLAIHYRILERNNLALDLLSTLGALAISFGVFGALYRFVPYDPSIRWRTVWLGAAVAASAWEIAKLVFAWYLTNYALLNLVYGSVGAVVAIMLWSYVTAAILLLGAEIAAVRAGARQREKHGDEWWAITAP